MSARTNRIITPLIVVFVLVTTAPTFAGKIIYVDDDGPADFDKIQAAIDAAVDTDIIVVSPGTYTGEGNRDIDFLGKAITVRSTDPCDPSIVSATIIDCNGTAEDPHRGFSFHSGEGLDSVVHGMTIRNGYGPEEFGTDALSCGGGIFCLESSPTISACIFEDNIADNDVVRVAPGGGIYLRNSSANIVDCNFVNNYAESGGAIQVSGSTSATTISNCDIIGNSTEFYGAGICTHGNSVISHCVIMHNSAGNYGGGIYGGLGNQKINNCLISGNSAEEFGGGIGYADSTLTIKNCTITGNSANISGGGVDFYFYCSAIISNCILWDNNADSGSEISIRYPHSPSDITVKYSDVQSGENTIYVAENSTLEWGPGNIDADPYFVDEANEDYHLLPNSPCIDTGDPDYVSGPNETDLDGRPRIIGGRIDMGAYESRVIYVDDDAAGANDGSSWNDAFNFLQDALVVAYSGDEIWVAQGIYKPDQGAGITPGDRYATFQLINGVTLKGGYASFGQPDPDARDVAAYETILSGDLAGDDGPDFTNNGENSYHVVTGSGTDETTVLDGFTITAGNASHYSYKDSCGGGMYNWFSSPTVINCTFTGNYAGNDDGGGHGAGMYNVSGNPTVTNCKFIDNSAIALDGGEGAGGGIYNGQSNPTLTNCTFMGNTAGHNGGGMYNYESGPTLTNCAFSGNLAREGGSGSYGGGMYNGYFCNPTLTNCTFSGNTARADYAEGGGGIYNGTHTSVTLINCIFWANSSSQGSQIFLYRSDKTSIRYCDIQDGAGGVYVFNSFLEWLDGNIDVDPCFVKEGYWDAKELWVEGDYHLLPDSPCIDTGDPNYIAGPNETDLDGNPRVINGRIDMGAYEYRFIISAEARILPKTINLASKGNWITSYIWLPDKYDVADIEPNSIFLEDKIQPEDFSVDQQKQVATATFDREKVQSILNVGDIELTITGRLMDGTVFEAIDIIKVTDKAGK